jgi:hypothetical protein
MYCLCHFWVIGLNPGVCIRFSAQIQIGAGAHRTSSTLGIGFLSMGLSGLAWYLMASSTGNFECIGRMFSIASIEVAGWHGVRVLFGRQDFSLLQNDQTGSGSHPDLC